MEKSLEKKLINEVSTPFYVFDINVLRDRIDYLNNGEFKDEKEKDNLIEFLNPTIKELIQRFILNQ